MTDVFLSLGSNMGERQLYLDQASALIRRDVGEIKRSSSIYETTPWGFQTDHLFLNQVILVETNLTPFELLTKLQQIEVLLGRIRVNQGEGYTSRTMDIDILFFGNEIVHTETLQLPHPHLHKRRFILEPMNEIASQLEHPILLKNINELNLACLDKGSIRRLL